MSAKTGRRVLKTKKKLGFGNSFENASLMTRPSRTAGKS
jgi:hypothetical protein